MRLIAVGAAPEGEDVPIEKGIEGRPVGGKEPERSVERVERLRGEMQGLTKTNRRAGAERINDRNYEGHPRQGAEGVPARFLRDVLVVAHRESVARGDGCSKTVQMTTNRD